MEEGGGFGEKTLHYSRWAHPVTSRPYLSRQCHLKHIELFHPARNREAEDVNGGLQGVGGRRGR